MDWFDLSFPLTADKVRMAAEDEAVLEAGKIIEKGPKKWAIEVWVAIIQEFWYNFKLSNICWLGFCTLIMVGLNTMIWCHHQIFYSTTIGTTLRRCTLIAIWLLGLLKWWPHCCQGYARVWEKMDLKMGGRVPGGQITPPPRNSCD